MNRREPDAGRVAFSRRTRERARARSEPPGLRLLCSRPGLMARRRGQRRSPVSLRAPRAGPGPGGCDSGSPRTPPRASTLRSPVRARQPTGSMRVWVRRRNAKRPQRQGVAEDEGENHGDGRSRRRRPTEDGRDDHRRRAPGQAVQRRLNGALCQRRRSALELFKNSLILGLLLR
jgi:hypothetical protein